ncbi:GGDEF domain-containing protein [Haloechinothrix aidingensis]|uniref:GGDEF domain-containing protein n=1 Tax=Haloechinothrix aidingensis TaxID=2752311 RepID=UPI003CCD3A88
MADRSASGAYSGGEDAASDTTAEVDEESREHEAGALRALRARWRTASLASGWRFPSDWALPEVDTVCATVMREGVTDRALSGLGRARAASGAGLEETLADLAALHAVLDTDRSPGGFADPDIDATPARFVRVTAVAWADVALDQLAHTEVTDSLTGLPTAAYLRTRLAEVYGRAARDGRSVPEDHVLLTVSVDLTDVTGWPRLTGMILIADVLRSVFDAGESIAVLGPSTIAVLADRSTGPADRAVAVRREANQRFLADPELSGLAGARIRVSRLCSTYADTCALLQELSQG